METVLFGSFLTQNDAIKESFKEMKPFLVINETGSYYHKLFFLLKILFVVYAFDRAVEKQFSVIFGHARNISGAYVNPVFRKILQRILSIFVIIFTFKVCFNSITAEFLSDIFVLIFLINYAVEAFKREFQKISCLIFLCLFVHWYINNTASTVEFRFRTYFQILALLFLSYLPMMPNRKNRHRLAFFYLLIFIWVLYKLSHHYNGYRFVILQNKTKGFTERQMELDPESGKLVDAFQNLQINDENICSDTENVESSCDKLQKVTPNKHVFPFNQEQTHEVSEKFEQSSKRTSFSENIPNEDIRKTIQIDTEDVKEAKKYGENSESQPGPLSVHDIKQYQLNASNSVVESMPQREDVEFKLHKIVHSDVDSTSNESNSAHRKSSDDETDKNILVMAESKEEIAQLQKTHFKEVPKSDVESTSEDPGKGKDATGVGSKSAVITETDKIADSHIVTSKDAKTAYTQDETSESSNADIKFEGMKVSNGKRKIRIFKRQGEIKDETSNVKANGLHGKMQGNDSAVQKVTNSENESSVIFVSGKQGTDGRNLPKIAKITSRKVSPLRIERRDGKELQIRNSGAGQSLSLIKPRKIRTIHSVKPLLSSTPILKIHDRKKDLSATGGDSPGRKFEKTGV